MTHCWTARYEAAGFDGRIEAFLALADVQPAEVDREAFLESLDDLCMLLDGHKGPHKWTQPGEIVVEFIK